MYKPLGDLAEIEYGSSPNNVRTELSDFPMFGTGGQVGFATKPLFKAPLVIVARKGTLDKPSFTEKDCWVIDTAYAVIPKNGIDAKWLFYNLDNYNLAALNEATGVPSISRDYLRRIEFRNFREKEQKKIAKIISSVDSLIENTETLIEKYQSIKQGMMHDFFTRGIDINGQLRPSHYDLPSLYKKTELGWIPKEWNIETLDILIEKYLDFRGKTPLKIGMQWGGGDIRALSANNVDMGSIDFTKECYMGSHELYEKWMNKGDCEKGDIVMTMEAPLGNVAQIPDNSKYILSQRVILLKVKKELIKKNYLFYKLMSKPFQAELIRNSTGTTATGIQQARLSKIRISYPKNTDEQELIAIRLNSIDALIESETKALNKYIKIKKGVMHDLLTGKKRVIIDDLEMEVTES